LTQSVTTKEFISIIEINSFYLLTPTATLKHKKAACPFSKPLSA
jgi:hypothetical protein